MKVWDVIVIGAGHAGCEAALAASRLGCDTLVVTLSIDKIGWMPCNPSIGGPAKGQIAGEIDALGGEMGRAADHTQIQMKVLNRSKGPAVQCLRSQNDKYTYHEYMRDRLLSQPCLTVVEGAAATLIVENGAVVGIETVEGVSYRSKTVVITTGTFLNGRIHVGMENESAGRDGEGSATHLSDCLAQLGLRLGRLKTGTTPRLAAESMDIEKMLPEPGDPEFLHFSFRTTYNTDYQNQVMCYLTQTTEKTHQVILDNLDRSPMFQKVIQGTGPRYCPSIEDKIFRFKDKPFHHLFMEPESRRTNEIYAQGLNTSMPADVQEAFLKTIPGLEAVKILKFGYAVEYDFVYPDQLDASLQVKTIQNLFLAGQINGTSGYEEAGGQGLVAGINAAKTAQGEDPFLLKREDSFIGTMIDDLITKNIYEPYRMLTSRSEYRMLLRQDNVTKRLSQRAFDHGLLSEVDMAIINDQHQRTDQYLKKWKKTSVSESIMSAFNLSQKIPIKQWAKRPEVTAKELLDHNLTTEEDIEYAVKAMVEIKYEGYITKQQKDIEKIQKFESKKIPDNFPYEKLQGLRQECYDKFEKYRPKTIYEAKRIAGVNPADIMILITYLERYNVRTT